MAATGTNKKITRDEMKTALLVAPGPIGGTTPGAGTFTTLTSTGNAALGDAEASDTHAIKGATTLLANSASAALTVTQTGAGNAFVVEDSASTDSTPFVIDGAGSVGIGGAAAAFAKVQITGTLPSSSSYSYGYDSSGSAPSTSTAGYFLFSTAASTQAAAFTITNLTHYNTYQGTIGATSVVTNQYGFNAVSSLTGATNNYGFYSNIASAANRWNFYAAGSAPNYFAGTLLTNVVTAIPAGGTVGLGIQFSSTSNFGVFFGSGAPTLIANKGSLYLRSDGSTTNNRMYVNTDGGTTWTAVTTAV
jgi:hypothetical protein